MFMRLFELFPNNIFSFCFYISFWEAASTCTYSVCVLALAASRSCFPEDNIEAEAEHILWLFLKNADRFDGFIFGCHAKFYRLSFQFVPWIFIFIFSTTWSYVEAKALIHWKYDDLIGLPRGFKKYFFLLTLMVTFMRFIWIGKLFFVMGIFDILFFKWFNNLYYP